MTANSPKSSKTRRPQQTLCFDLALFAAHLDAADLPRQIRRLLIALATVGARDPSRVTRDDDEDNVDEFFGDWLIQASKAELAHAVRRNSKTIQRDLDWFDRAGGDYRDLLQITHEENAAHFYFVCWPAVREVPPHASPEMSQGQSKKTKMSPGHVLGTKAASPIMGSMGNGFLDSSGTNKSKPIHPSRARIVWRRKLSRADLADVGVLQAVFPIAVAAGVAQKTDRDWIAFVALARYCYRDKKARNHGGLFTSILEGRSKSKFDRGKPWQARPADKDTDWAIDAINKAKPAAGANRDVAEMAATIGNPDETRGGGRTFDEKKRQEFANLAAMQSRTDGKRER